MLSELLELFVDVTVEELLSAEEFAAAAGSLLFASANRF